MRGNIYENNALPSIVMVIFVSLLIWSIPKKYALKTLGIQFEAIRLRNMNIINATKHFERK